MKPLPPPLSKDTLPFENFDFSVLDNNATIYSTINLPSINEDEIPSIYDHLNLEKENPSLARISQLEILGEGRIGVIYLGQQQLPQRHVAIKKLRKEKHHLANELLKEALVMGRLNHPNIPPIYQIQFDQKHRPEVIMKNIEGRSFQEILRNEEQHHSNRKNALDILFQVCHVVEFAHSEGVLHCDLKTENIIVGEFNQVYVMNWGLSINLDSSSEKPKKLAGSPAYMAPEMLMGDPNILTPATDVFLLGAILHEILTGEYRNQGSTIREVLITAHKTKPYQYSENIPEILTNLCNWACSKDPSERPQSALIFRQHLEDIIVNWEAINLLQKGNIWLEDYKERWQLEQKKEHFDDLALYQVALQAKFAFEQALELWSNLKQAKKNLIETIELIIQQSLKAKEFQRALLLYEDCSIYFSRKNNIEKLFAEVLRAWEIEKHREASLSKTKKQLDPSLSHKPRLGLSMVLGSIIFIGISIVGLWRYLNVTINMKDNFYFTLFTMLPLWIGLAIFYKRLQINAFSQQVFRTLLFNTITIVLAAYGCWSFETDINLVYILYSLISSLVWINAAPVIEKGKQLGILGLFVSIFSIFLPDLSQFLFLLLVSLAGMVIAFDWKRHLPII